MAHPAPSAPNLPKECWVLCCTKNGILKAVTQNGHDYRIHPEEPLGGAMHNAHKDSISKPAPRFVLISDVAGHSNGKPHAFEELARIGGHESPHYQYNCGKNEALLHLVSHGREVTGGDTGVTMQSFHTWLRNYDKRYQNPVNGGKNWSSYMADTFQVISHIRGCKNGKCYTGNINHHFHFVPYSRVLSICGGEPGAAQVISMNEARQDFLKDTDAILQNIENLFPETHEVYAEDGYANVTNSTNQNKNIKILLFSHKQRGELVSSEVGYTF